MSHTWLYLALSHVATYSSECSWAYTGLGSTLQERGSPRSEWSPAPVSVDINSIDVPDKPLEQSRCDEYCPRQLALVKPGVPWPRRMAC